MRSAGFQCWRLGRFSMVGSLGAILQLVLLYAMTKWLHIHEIAAAPMESKPFYCTTLFGTNGSRGGGTGSEVSGKKRYDFGDSMPVMV